MGLDAQVAVVRQEDNTEHMPLACMSMRSTMLYNKCGIIIIQHRRFVFLPS